VIIDFSAFICQWSCLQVMLPLRAMALALFVQPRQPSQAFSTSEVFANFSLFTNIISVFREEIL
jgi:hypothetical protein